MIHLQATPLGYLSHADVDSSSTMKNRLCESMSLRYPEAASKPNQLPGKRTALRYSAPVVGICNGNRIVTREQTQTCP